MTPCRSGSRQTTVKLAYSAGFTCRWLGYKLSTAYNHVLHGLGFAGKEHDLRLRPPVHFPVYRLRAPSTAALFLLKEVSMATQIVLVGSVGVTRRLGAQNGFSSLGQSGAENKPYCYYAA